MAARTALPTPLHRLPNRHPSGYAHPQPLPGLPALSALHQHSLRWPLQVRTRRPATAERRFLLESEEPPGCWAASGKAQASLPIPARWSETEAVPMHLPVPPKTEVAEDQRSEASLEELARPAEVCATQIVDSKTAESTDLLSISSDLAGSRPRCASFICANSSTLEVEQGELEWADQAIGDPRCLLAVPPHFYCSSGPACGMACPACPAKPYHVLLPA